MYMGWKLAMSVCAKLLRVQVIWTAGEKSLLLWHAFTGTCLGLLQREATDLDGSDEKKAPRIDVTKVTSCADPVQAGHLSVASLSLYRLVHVHMQKPSVQTCPAQYNALRRVGQSMLHLCKQPNLNIAQD